MFNNFFFQIRSVEKILWRNIVEPGSPQLRVWHMRIACWILKSTNTHSEYVIHIALPLQQYLHERACVLRYRCIACPVEFLFVIVCNYNCCQFHSSGLVCLLFLYSCGDFVIGLYVIKPARN
jgi:hypothetical protein